ncbi:hypothetical protein [Actinoplanes sp. NPDC051859]|uniref:hypothetical protein n=1 Tax=Actinoplanes sp. NPDC051859 TaxID=3363909 RepID=UPI0037A9D01D
MADLEALERRIAAIEERLEMEAGLRASGDRDLAGMAQTLRAQQHTIQALAITQSQHNEKLDHHNEKLDQQNERLDRHEASLSAAHGKLDQIIALLGQLTEEEDGGRSHG